MTQPEASAEVVRAESRAFRFVRLVARLLLRSQYRQIEVEGAEHVPATGAVLLVANHFSSLVDSMALLEASPRPASFLAKAPLWKSKLLAPFLNSVGAVPVYRPQDMAENKGRGTRANMATFEACRARLAEGGSMAIFPEGVSQPQPRLMPVRTGAARIALDVGKPVTVCPAGLVFEHDPDRRGRLLVRFGEPFVVDGIEGFPSRRQAITVTTRRIEAALRDLLAEAESQGELEAMRTLRVVWDQERGSPGARTLREAHRRDRRFAQGLAALKTAAPEALESLRAETDAYQRSLALAGIPHELLRGRYSVGRVTRFVLTNGPLLLLGFPIALLAAVVTWPIRRCGDVVALRAFGGAEDVRPLCRMLGGAILLVLLMIVGGVLAWWWFGVWVALAVVIGLPCLLAFHIAWRDRSADVKARVRTFFLLAGGNLRKELVKQRRALYRALLATEPYWSDAAGSAA
ncbi:MAG: 1-acyl-sn-glycerol-3-phosphate acyltransferase [Planctomycetota bacterium]|nr:1-acyl-sn-glycerol-3-phosphate acyltransferase [Planctomycetota bacterium]